MSSPATEPAVSTCSDVGADVIRRLLGRYGVAIEWQSAGSPLTGSFWGEPEAGILRQQVFVRPDTPVHSLLHELCHIICMTPDRRDALDRDAGGDDLEEVAVCYLQLVLADYLPGVGRHRLMQDMDAWGYSFRHGTTKRWFENDAADARAWLIDEGLLSSAGEPVFKLRGI
jgi:hypothetical protein